MYVIGTLESSSSVTPSRHPTFTPYILPIGVSLPTPKARTPQCLQKKCWFLRVLKRYSVRCCSPTSRRKPSGRATAGQKRVLRQIEQLQRKVLCDRSRSASKRTAPQWRLPRYVLSMSERLEACGMERLSGRPLSYNRGNRRSRLPLAK